MSIKVRVLEIQIENFKNVLSGTMSFPSAKTKSFKSADVLGIYGQNGSGKTAVVQAFQLLSQLLQGKSLKKETQRLIHQGENTLIMNFTFLVALGNKNFECLYSAHISKFDTKNDDSELEDIEDKQTVYVSKEEFRYKELSKGARTKTAIWYLKDDEESSVGPIKVHSKIKSNRNDNLVTYKVNAQLAYKESSSFLFRKEGVDLAKEVLDDEVFKLLRSLKHTFVKNLFVMDNRQSSLILANLMLPVRFKRSTKKNGEKEYGDIIFQIDEPQKMSVESYNIVSSIIENISKVLQEVVPGLSISLVALGEQTLKDGSTGMRAELLSIREGKRLPIILESEGIKKLIFILSSLVAMYNNEDACIVIDELDAGIFEFLLGEVVQILNDYGKGQLLFTSHNLRLLEVLNKENLVFTSVNPNERYINLKGIKDTNNIRDVYIRAVQLGNEDESVYALTDRYNIMDAFEEAGEATYG